VRLKSESDHEQLQQLVDAYLKAGGKIHRTNHRPLMVCTVCRYRMQMDAQYAPRLASRCRRCGGIMKAW
jgi:hypothetical protein